MRETIGTICIQEFKVNEKGVAVMEHMLVLFP